MYVMRSALSSYARGALRSIAVFGFAVSWNRNSIDTEWPVSFRIKCWTMLSARLRDRELETEPQRMAHGQHTTHFRKVFCVSPGFNCT